MKYFIYVLFITLTLASYGQDRLNKLDFHNTNYENSDSTFFGDVVHDYKNFYTKKTVDQSLFWIGIGAVMANTEMDHNINDWYQNNVRSYKTDQFASDVKHFGEGSEIIPILVGTALLGYYAERYNIDSNGYMYDWGTKSLRTMFVGAPVLLFGQVATGGGRATDDDKSYWKPFKDNNGVSGHAFMGAVPFLTAAHMTDDKILKGAYYLGSTLTAWSRFNDNDHYLSQAILGWSLAYVSSLAVFEKDSPFILSPIIDNGRLGITFSIRF